MDEQHELIGRLEQLYVGLVGITALALRESGTRPELTLLQWRALEVLGGSSEPVRVGEIARVLPTSPSSTTRIVERLRRRGFVESQRTGDDRRGVWLRLTTSGRTEHQTVSAYRTELLLHALSAIETDGGSGNDLAAVADAIGRFPMGYRIGTVRPTVP